MTQNKITINKGGKTINKPEIIMITDECTSVTVEVANQDDDIKIHHTTSISRGDAYIKLLSGEAYEMLITAVNNRTIERDYFRLYCEMLDGSISQEEFMHIIDENESDYIVDENKEPSISEISLALRLAEKLKSVDTLNDLSSLFSFNPDSLERMAALSM